MTNRFIMGNLGSGVYGLKISKPTIDVLSATASQLLFDSTSGVTRVLTKGSLVIPNGTISGTVTFAAQTSKPIVDIRRPVNPDEFLYPSVYTLTGYSTNIFPWDLTINTDSFTLAYPSAGHATTTFSYIIFANPL